MQNKKGLRAKRAKTRLAGPRKKSPLNAKAANFQICRQIVVFSPAPKSCTASDNGKKISYFKFLDDVNLKKRWLHALGHD